MWSFQFQIIIKKITLWIFTLYQSMSLFWPVFRRMTHENKNCSMNIFLSLKWHIIIMKLRLLRKKSRLAGLVCRDTDTAQPWQLLKPNWKPSSSHSISSPASIIPSLCVCVRAQVRAHVCVYRSVSYMFEFVTVCVCLCVCVFHIILHIYA